MSGVFAIDFGTSNTVVSEWSSARRAAESINLPGLTRKYPLSPPSVPSVIFFDNASSQAVRLGYAIIRDGLDEHEQANERLFRSMKRGVLNPQTNKTVDIDGVRIDSGKAAEVFLNRICQALLATSSEIDGLVLTAPVMAFEIYLRWLASAVRGLQLPANTVPRVLDEPTAAAFGYGIDMPRGLVLVIDFGGGTLDLSLVQLPADSDRSAGGIVIPPGSRPEVTLAQSRSQIAARVIAKTSRSIGGDDIDEAFVDWLLEVQGWSRHDVRKDMPLLLRVVEEAKIGLGQSNDYMLSAYLQVSKKSISRNVTVQEFEHEVLNSPAIGLQNTLMDAISEVVADGRRRNVGEKDIEKVLLVGGSTLIPVVQKMIRQRFGTKVVSHKPFEAVAHGALGLATSHPLEDILQHSYVLEVRRSTGNGTPEFDYLPLLRSGTSYPMDAPVELDTYLKPLADGTKQIDFIIAELAERQQQGARIVYDASGKALNDRHVHMLAHEQVIRHLRDKCTVYLDPPGMSSEDERLDLIFFVDENRRLLLTIFDRVANRWLVREEPVTRLE